MTIQNASIFILITVGVFLGIGQAAGEITEKAALRSYHEVFIDKLISNCKYKEAFMYDSRSENLCQGAAIGCLKAAYLKSHKEMLIEDIIASEIGKKPYMIQYYLNNKFFSVLRTATMTAKL
jgi:hypothetical protein